MPQFELRENSGSLFKNAKGDNEKRPDYRGDANVNGELYEIASWIKQGKNGKFMSLSFKPKERQPGEDKEENRGFGDMDDDIPM